MYKEYIIIIPIYKKNMTNDEQYSLEQCCNVLQQYEICFIAPNDLECSEYEKIISKFNVNAKFKFFEKKYFESIKSYSNFMLNKNFYKEFLEYKWMLIYQLDAWVFRDELQEWGKKGFDYVGAPWFEGYEKADDKSRFLQNSGNGGFSLRNVKKMYETIITYEENFKGKRIKSIKEVCPKTGVMKILLNIFKILKMYYSNKNTYSFVMEYQNEDASIANYFPIFNENFKVATAKEALAFSFEMLPKKLFKLNNNKLPFGCHAFKKYDWEFWKEYIDIEKL